MHCHYNCSAPQGTWPEPTDVWLHLNHLQEMDEHHISCFLHLVLVSDLPHPLWGPPFFWSYLLLNGYKLHFPLMHGERMRSQALLTF